jgi:mRNA (guanine-N7-)-methyltransferase
MSATPGMSQIIVRSSTGGFLKKLMADNSRPEVGVQHRELSPIIGLKKFNNWIKSVLIGKFAFRGGNRPGANVLDLGCGKGGDLNKWKQARIRLYVGMGESARIS